MKLLNRLAGICMLLASAIILLLISLEYKGILYVKGFLTFGLAILALAVSVSAAIFFFKTRETKSKLLVVSSLIIIFSTLIFVVVGALSWWWLIQEAMDAYPRAVDPLGWGIFMMLLASICGTGVLLGLIFLAIYLVAHRKFSKAY